MTDFIPNHLNQPYTLKDYKSALKPFSFALAPRNRDFEAKLSQEFSPERRELSHIRQELNALSTMSFKDNSIQSTDYIAVRPAVTELFRTKVCLQRPAESPIHPLIKERVKDFRKAQSLNTLGYPGGDIHDYNHLITGFSPKSTKGEASQVIFDMYFHHFMRGFLPNETLGNSFKPDIKIAKIASAQMSLIGDFHSIQKYFQRLISLPTFHDGTIKETKRAYSREIDITIKALSKITDFMYNQWQFPNGYDDKLTNTTLKQLEKFLSAREARFSQNANLYSLQKEFFKHWLDDQKINDIVDYANYAALKCMAHLAVLKPEGANQTIQQTMDKNGYFNMSLLQNSIGVGTNNELKLPNYSQWQKMREKRKDLDFNALIKEKISSKRS